MLSSVSIDATRRYAVFMKDLDDDTRTFLFKTWGYVRKFFNLYLDLYYQELGKAWLCKRTWRSKSMLPL